MDDARKLVLSLEQITNRIVGGLDLDEALDGIVSALTEILRAGRCSVMVKTAPGVLRMRAAVGIPDSVVEQTIVRLGEGIAGEVARSGEARLLRDLDPGAADGRTAPYATGSAICAPLRLRGDVLGVINLNDKRGRDGRYREFDEDDLMLAVVLANQGAMAIEAARSMESAREQALLRKNLVHLEAQVDALEGQAAALQVVQQVTDLVVSSHGLDEVLTRIVRGTTSLLGARRGSLMLVDPQSGEMRMRAAVGVPAEVFEGARSRVGRGIAGGVALRGEPTLIRDLSGGDGAAHPRRRGQYRNHSAVCVPLRLGGEVLGVLNINDRHDARDFDQTDLFVAELIANQAAVALAHARLLDESVQAAETRRALEVAREIQQSFIPEDARVAGYRVSGRSLAADETGGDYIDYGPRRDRHGHPTGELFLAVGDVSGHGIGAALLMATSRAFLRALLAHGDHLADVFGRLNRLVQADLRRGQFITLFAGIADPTRGRLVYTSAGHDPPLLLHADTGKLSELGATGPPLGILEEVAFPTADVAFRPGDLLVLGTDGVWEAASPRGDCFGRDRLAETVRAHAELDPRGVVDGIQAEVSAFAEGRSLRDDFSLVVVRAEDRGAP